MLSASLQLKRSKLLSSKRHFQFQVKRDLFSIFQVAILPKRRNIYMYFVLCDTKDCFKLFNHAKTSVGILKGFGLICKVLKNYSINLLQRRFTEIRLKQSLYISFGRCCDRCLWLYGYVSLAVSCAVAI